MECHQQYRIIKGINKCGSTILQVQNKFDIKTITRFYLVFYSLRYPNSYAPYGYMKDPDNHNRLIINPDNYKYIKYIFNEASKGIPPSIIAKNLNLMGVITPKDYINSKLNKVGGKSLWKYNMILKILNNETYVGDLIQHKYKRVSYKIHKLVNTNESERIIVRNAHESIIDKKTF